MEQAIHVTTFFLMMTTGAILGVLYEVVGVLRRRLGCGAIMTAAADLLFWLLATAIVLLMLLAGNWGELRLYVFIGLLIGGAVYIRIFRRTIKWSIEKIADGIATPYRWGKVLVRRIIAFANRGKS